MGAPTSSPRPTMTLIGVTLTFRGVTGVSQFVTRASEEGTLSVMPATLQSKINAEHRLRELLRTEGLPQPDEVEYGHSCVRFFYHESRTCIVVDLEPAAGDDGSNGGGPDQ